MVKNVVREHHWAPSQVGALYFDAQDYKGLYYWNKDIEETNAEIEKLKKK